MWNKNKNMFGPFNIGNDNEITIMELLKNLKKLNLPNLK